MKCLWGNVKESDNIEDLGIDGDQYYHCIYLFSYLLSVSLVTF
jgi:hypothetical protein